MGNTITYLSGVCRPEILNVRPDLGLMLTPRAGNRPNLAGTYWAQDNGLYHEFGTSERVFNDTQFWTQLNNNAEYRGNNLFVVVPDVPFECVNTLTSSMLWWPALRRTGYPLALALQDGIEQYRIPWEVFDVAFLGGGQSEEYLSPTNRVRTADGRWVGEWKLTPAAAELAGIAKARGLRVHMGRVNSLKRMCYAKEIGCDTVDGTYLRYPTPGNVARLFSWLDYCNGPQPTPIRSAPAARLEEVAA